MKYVITIKQVDEQPKDWTSKDAWPGPGIYAVKSDKHALYHISETGYSVDYIPYGEMFVSEPFNDPGEQVSESLLLKAIAAASRAETLKGSA